MNRTSPSLFLIRALLFRYVSGLVWAQNHDAGLSLGKHFRSWTENNSSSFFNSCKLKHGSTAVYQIEDQWRRTAVCFEETISEANRDVSLSRILNSKHAMIHSTINNITDPIISFCNDYKPLIENCVRPLFIALKGCADDEGGRNVINLQSNGLSNALNYICENNGNRIFKFVSEGSSECLQLTFASAILNNDGIQQCSVLNITHHFDWNVYFNSPKNTCRFHQKLNECFVAQFQKCNSVSDGMKTMFAEFLDILMNKAACYSIITNDARNEGGSRNCANVLILCLMIFLCNISR